MLVGKGVRGGGGAKSFDGEKAWFSKIIQYSLALNNNLSLPIRSCRIQYVYRILNFDI